MPIKIRHQEVNLVTNIRFRYKANFDGLVFTTKFGSENCKIIWQKVKEPTFMHLNNMSIKIWPHVTREFGKKSWSQFFMHLNNLSIKVWLQELRGISATILVVSSKFCRN